VKFPQTLDIFRINGWNGIARLSGIGVGACHDGRNDTRNAKRDSSTTLSPKDHDWKDIGSSSVEDRVKSQISLAEPLSGDTSDTIPVMTNLTSVLNQLQQERNRLASQLQSLNSAITALNGTGNSGGRKRTMSASGRARIAAAQRARWAKLKGKKVVSITARKRTMPASARRRIAAAQKARWAKWRKAQKG
jgi:hypothetical protein